MNRFLYSTLLYMATPFVLLRLALRARKAPAYGLRWKERFGFFPALSRDKPVIWVHSVSVGETIASAPLVRELITAYPEYRIMITTMTPTGSDRVKDLHKAYIGDRVQHVYCPYDLPDAQKRFLDRVNPAMALIVDTELWPNTVAACRKRNIPVVIVNARLSERSAKGYAKFGGLTHTMLNNLSVVACQSKDDGQRFIDLGLPEGRLQVTGSVKFDLTVEQDTIEQGRALRKSWETGLGHAARVLIAASTHDGEDQQILDSYKSLLANHDDLLLLLVPRHPERFNDVYQLIQENQLEVIRHSESSKTRPAIRVILGDTMGEMMKLFAASDIAFVGGSLVATGGHNMLEPAALGLPVLSGPHIFNFTDISQQLEQAGGLRFVNDSGALTSEVRKLLDNDDHYREMSQNATDFVNQNRGALERTLTVISRLL